MGWLADETGIAVSWLIAWAFRLRCLRPLRRDKPPRTFVQPTASPAPSAGLPSRCSLRRCERRLVGLSRFELLTPRLSSVCSNQLSYRPFSFRIADFSMRFNPQSAFLNLQWLAGSLKTGQCVRHFSLPLSARSIIEVSVRRRGRP